MTACKIHPKYKAMLSPNTNCADCWLIWKEAGGMKIWDFIPEFAKALVKHLKEKDDPRWGDTWLKRTRRGQEERTIANFNNKFDKYLNGSQSIDWLAIAGDALICWIREQHPEIWTK